MAKKTRRPNIPETTLERARRQMGSAPVEQPVVVEQEKPQEAAPKPAPRPRTQLSSADLRAEYAYVVSDLQNMGVLAGAFLIVLVALAFVL